MTTEAQYKALGISERVLAFARPVLASLEERMLAAAQNLEFEEAAKLRDQLLSLRGEAPVKKPIRQRRSRAPRSRKSEH